jgi:GPH family glycoside/pentoside/hexuronide:cation symporter
LPQQRVDLGTRIAYGSGGIATAVKDAAVVHFVSFFFTQVAGLPAEMFGWAVGIAQVVDAVLDPMIGTWSDNHRSRFGRRHPFMLAAIAPYALGFVLFFSPPSGLGNWALFAWAAGFSIGLRLLLSTFAIPHAALGAELSADYVERSSIAGIRTMLAWLGGILLPAGAWVFVFRKTPGGGDPRLVAANYATYAWLSAGLIVTSCGLSVFGTRKTIPSLPVPREVRQLSLLDPFKDVADALRNNNFRRVFVALALAGATTGVSTMLGTYAGAYFWEFEPQAVGLLTLAAIPPTLVAFAFVRPLSARFEKKSLYFATLLVFILNAAWFTGGRLLGWLPENGARSLLALAMLNQFFVVLALVLNGTVWASMIADIADEHEVETGERKDGVFFAAQAFALKVPTGLGQMAGGFVIAWIGIERGMTPGNVSADVLFRLGLVAGPLVALSLLAPLAVMLGFDLDRKRHAELRAALDARARR